MQLSAGGVLRGPGGADLPAAQVPEGRVSGRSGGGGGDGGMQRARQLLHLLSLLHRLHAHRPDHRHVPALIPSVDGLLACLVVFNAPFTLLKGLLDTALCFLIYKPLSPLLHK